MSKKVYLKSWGCQMNEYDSELVRSILTKARFNFVNDEAKADIILLNTCSVRDHAVRKVFGHIHEIRHRDPENKILIGVLGCMATHLKDEIIDNRKLKIDFLVGPDSYKRLPEIIAEALKGHKSQATGHKLQATGHRPQQKISDITLSEFETYSDIYPIRNSGVNAWLAVMRGCNNFCTFCVVPYARGRERSRTPDDILAEVKKLSKEGFPQVTLLGQNVNSYKSGKTDFADLVTQISCVKGIKRIRFMSPHPKDFPDKLIAVVAQNPKVCKHIHLPLQAGNDQILKLMNRRYTKKDYLELVDKIRQTSPGIALTTDIIVGFPTETEKEFEDTVDIVKSVRFDSAFIFKYSPRAGTVAAKKFADDVLDDEKTKRIVYLNQLQKQITIEINRSYIGKIEEVLIEEEQTSKSDKDFQGRTDTNKLVIIPAGNYRRGDFVQIKITGSSTHALKGKIVDELSS